MIYRILLEELPYLMQGALVVIELAAGLLTLGLAVGLVLALMEVYGNRVVALAATLFDRFFRGVPAAVLLFLFYYGLSDLYNISSFSAAIMALGLRSGAYQSQIFKGAIMAISEGQMVAARALGMTKSKAIRKIILPQAFRLSIGPWSNEFSGELKATSLAYLIGVVELLRRGKYIVSYTYGNSLVVFSFCALIYFILTRIGNSALYKLEKKVAVPGFDNRQVEG